MVGPTWVEASDAYRLSILSPRGVVFVEIERPSAPIGSLVDLGRLESPVGAALAIEVIGVDAIGSVEIDYQRIPHSDAPSYPAAAALRRYDPDLADLVFDATRRSVARDQTVALAPLPPDLAARLTLIAPSGAKLPPVEVPLTPGKTSTVVLDAAPLAAAIGRELTGTVVWAHTGEPVTGVLAAPRLRRTAPLEPTGRFALGKVETDRAVDLTLTDFDPLAPERIERLRVTAGEAIQWSVAPLAWIRARGLPSGETPAVFALERWDDERGFVRATLEEARPTPDGVDILAPSGSVYRVIAAWDAILLQQTAPVDLAADGSAADVPFAPVSSPRWYAGRVVRTDGTPVGFAQIEISGPIGALPPITLQTDADGRFRVGPATAEEVSILALSERFSGEETLTPDAEPEVTITIR